MNEEQKKLLSVWAQTVQKQLNSLTELLIKLEARISQLENNKYGEK